MTNCSLIGPTVQYLGQVNLTPNRTNDTGKGINVMNFLLQFLQDTSRALRRNQINLVKNYNILHKQKNLTLRCSRHNTCIIFRQNSSLKRQNKKNNKKIYLPNVSSQCKNMIITANAIWKNASGNEDEFRRSLSWNRRFLASTTY